MLKASLLVAAAFSIFAVAGSVNSHAQDGSRQIVVEPVELPKKKGPGTGGGGGQGTGGGGGLGTGGGKEAPGVVATPGSDGEVDPAPQVATGGPASDNIDPLDAIIAPDQASASTGEVKEEGPPATEKAPAATATTTVAVDSPEDLIVLLKSKGYQVEIARHEKGGDYVLVVHEEKEKVSGYLLVVDGKHGKVVGKKKIELADYGYGQDGQYGKKKKPDQGYDEGYDDDSGYEDDSSYDDGSSHGGGGSDY